MKEAIQLYGLLILAMLSIVSPFLVIFLSLFREGFYELSKQYEEKRKQIESNLKDQVIKLAKAKESKVEEIENSLKANIQKLNNVKKEAIEKLSILNPRKQLFSLFIPIFLSFITIIIAILFIQNFFVLIPSLVISVGTFIYFLIILSKMLNILIELRKNIIGERTSLENKIIELLATFKSKSTEYFLKNIDISINDNLIKGNSKEIILNINTEKELFPVIRNHERRMIKNLELTIKFPKDFIIEKSATYRLSAIEDNQYIRFNSDFLHGNTNLRLVPLKITPIKGGKFNIVLFLNAENIETKEYSFKLKIIGE